MRRKMLVGNRIKILALLVVILVLGLASVGCVQGESNQNNEEIRQEDSTEATPKQFKIVHVMSYDSSWIWNQDQFNGFKKALEGLDVEYKIVEMDTKRHDSAEWKEQMGREARDLIDTWHPDLVYANDDDAQEYVVKYYINSDIPFVFSAVNHSPEEYGFTESTNITGVLEQEHFVGTVQLLQEIVPNAKKIAVIVDESPMWDPVIARIQEKADQFPDLEFVSWDVIYTFEEFKQKMNEYQTTVDAVGLIGIFNFKDENGENVPYQEVLQWTAENSTLPDFSFWRDRVAHGTLCTVTVSGYEQGLAAGKIARGILEGEAPASFPMQTTAKGEPAVSLARAQQLNIDIKSDILLTTEIFTDFAWEK